MILFEVHHHIIIYKYRDENKWKILGTFLREIENSFCFKGEGKELDWL